MKREEKNALSRQRILDAAMEEFSAKGYGGASLNAACAEYGISKGIVYHHFKDKDELYLLCVRRCFEELAAYMQKTLDGVPDGTEEKLQAYFEARVRFFAENPLMLGIFADAVFGTPPPKLAGQIAECRGGFDRLSIAVLRGFLSGRVLREGVSSGAVAEDLALYMDYFNMRFREAYGGKAPSEEMLEEHEKRCRRQLDILLHGVLGEE